MAEPVTPESIAAAAAEPAEAVSDGQSAKAVPIPDQIAADKYAKQAEALKNGKSAWGGARMARAVPPGAT